MPRYIEIDNLEVSDYVTVWDCDCSEFGRQTVMAVDDLNYLPTADVAEVRHAYWIKDETYTGKHREIYYCSSCNHWQANKKNIQTQRALYMNNCPQCGARMDMKGVDNE